MSPTSITTLLKWIFLAVGVVIVTGALIGQPNGAFVMYLVGLPFLGMGGGMVANDWWSAKKEVLLRQHGSLIQAEFQQVELNLAWAVNGAHPYRIVAQWHDKRNNRLFVFRSANLWFDPTRFVVGRSVPVYVDLSRPDRYHVDTSFLPVLHD
jgi:hypothetical protein